jgi:mono/diheme cytochrome c family protein
MNKNFKILLFTIIFGAIFVSACGGSAKPANSGAAESNEVPAQYAGKVNPFEGKADAAATGKGLYETNCLSCHGPKGEGDGPASASLTPKAANLLEGLREDDIAFVFYRISEGGMQAPFNSSMPAWKDSLSEDQRWQIITYLETYK